MENIFGSLANFLVKHYLILGLFFMTLGVIYILACIKNWTWLIKPRFDDAIRNRMFGMDTTRIRFGLLGVAFFLGGLIIFVANIISLK